uniref:NADH dehydrogenase subunit 4L n=1 Tax=Penthe kochi TaxID=2952706 RepID=UPI0021143B41|nr:NADH dehydrogenase subunit 4L [Penthe kochi]USG58931.1 NADH dehydrogenase subunit 4L [Penthe kochi]
MLMYKVLFMFMFFSGVIVFSFKHKHLLMMLLSLELIVLSIYLGLFIYMSLIGNDYFFSMIFLSFSVCEGVLGLSLLILLIRTHGNDYFQSLNLLC